MERLRKTWFAGGIALIACGVLGVLRSSLLGVAGGEVLSVATDLAYAVGVGLLAIGLSREASVVARKPLGVVTMLLVALWPLIAQVTGWMLAVGDAAGVGAAWIAFGYLSLVIPLGAGIVAAVQIGRAGVVERPWRWAPLWVLGFQALAWALPQIFFLGVGVGSGAGDLQQYANLFAMLSTVAFLAGTLGLGILALVLAAKRRPASVDVYSSS